MIFFYSMLNTSCVEYFEIFKMATFPRCNEILTGNYTENKYNKKDEYL